MNRVSGTCGIITKELIFVASEFQKGEEKEGRLKSFLEKQRL